jgi:hypothetical protein
MNRKISVSALALLTAGCGARIGTSSSEIMAEPGVSTQKSYSCDDLYGFGVVFDAANTIGSWCSEQNKLLGDRGCGSGNLCLQELVVQDRGDGTLSLGLALNATFFDARTKSNWNSTSSSASTMVTPDGQTIRVDSNSSSNGTGGSGNGGGNGGGGGGGSGTGGSATGGGGGGGGGGSGGSSAAGAGSGVVITNPGGTTHSNGSSSNSGHGDTNINGKSIGATFFVTGTIPLGSRKLKTVTCVNPLTNPYVMMIAQNVISSPAAIAQRNRTCKGR